VESISGIAVRGRLLVEALSRADVAAQAQHRGIPVAGDPQEVPSLQQVRRVLHEDPDLPGLDVVELLAIMEVWKCT